MNQYQSLQYSPANRNRTLSATQKLQNGTAAIDHFSDEGKTTKGAVTVDSREETLLERPSEFAVNRHLVDAHIPTDFALD